VLRRRKAAQAVFLFAEIKNSFLPRDRARPEAEIKPVRLADHGVARDGLAGFLAQRFGDLGGGLAVVPKAAQAGDAVIGPDHCFAPFRPAQVSIALRSRMIRFSASSGFIRIMKG